MINIFRNILLVKNRSKIRILTLGLFFISIITNTFSQEIELKGEVKDSVKRPVQNVNLVAYPTDSTLQTKFSITDSNGKYLIKLQPDKHYLLKVSHLMYKLISDSISINKNSIKDYILSERTEKLDEILIEQEMAVIVKKDTVRYKVDKFKTGDERKLRDILKKLPGIEVDRDGNVKVNGKKVTKLMIEGQTFFTGDPKLGVNNIPADAVAEIEALDNNPEIAMLKSLDDSDKMVLNIKLKEDKKRFLFGESEAGGGIKERYYINPNIFYYSPKRSLNVLGDFNNIGESAFTYSDLISFEGGFYQLRNTQNKFATTSSGISSSFNGFKNVNRFGASSWSEKVGKNLRLDAYAIIKNGTSENRKEQEVTYYTDVENLESRSTNSEINQFLSLAKLKLRYNNLNDWDVQTNLVIKNILTDNIERISSNSINGNLITDNNSSLNSLTINNVNSINKRFSYKHTLSLNTNFEYTKQDDDNRWNTNKPIFTNIIPYQDTSSNIIKLNKNSNSTTNIFQIDAKHYWILNNTNHLYPSIGINYLKKNFNNQNFQKFDNDSIIDFKNAGFNNDLEFKLWDTFGGAQFKHMMGNWIGKVGVFAHIYSWKAHQFSSEIINRHKTAILPEAMIKWNINDVEEFRLDYSLNSVFADSEKFANRYQINSFNNVYRGNEQLENELYHYLNMSYRNSNYKNKIYYNISIGYSSREKSIQQVSQLDGINYISTSILTSLPENTYNSNFALTKRFDREFILSLNTNFQFSDYDRLINGNQLSYKSGLYSYKIKGKFFKSNMPTVELSFKHSFNSFNSNRQETSWFTELNPTIGLSYRFFENFLINADYDYIRFKNQNTNEINNFQIGDAEITYKKDSNAWGVSLKVKNLFDQHFTQNINSTEFLISNQKTFIQPRIILLKLIYQL